MKLSFPETSRKKAFKELYETYYAPFCLYAKRYIDDRPIREDLVSDVFATLWDKQEAINFDSGTTLAYLKMCVRNNCLNYLKHREYEWNYAEAVQVQAPIYEEEPDSVYTLDELYHMLYDALNKLPENYRKVFVKSFFDGMTHAEIAEEMELSVKSVNRYKQKTMDFLRQELKDFLPIFLIMIASKSV